VPADRLLAELVPPTRFARERFSTYRPDPAQATQAEAVRRLETFAADVADADLASRWWPFGRRSPAGPAGVYLDGGFGVGKTHLLASLPAAPSPLAADAVAAETGRRAGATLDDFDALLVHLASVHPSRYGALLDGVSTVELTGVHQLDDQAVALRLVVLADRLYDREIPVLASGEPLDRLFSAEMLAGGYRKKYRRATSRLVALAREGGVTPPAAGDGTTCTGTSPGPPP
jgi:predicted ATPase